MNSWNLAKTKVRGIQSTRTYTQRHLIAYLRNQENQNYLYIPNFQAFVQGTTLNVCTIEFSIEYIY